MMSTTLRTGFLGLATLLLFIGAAGNAFVIVPDLHGDLVEIGVRPTVLNTTVMALHASAMASFGFAVIVLAATIDAIRERPLARIPLAVVAAITMVQGVTAFSQTHSPHHFASIAMSVLIAGALLVPSRL